VLAGANRTVTVDDVLGPRLAAVQVSAVMVKRRRLRQLDRQRPARLAAGAGQRDRLGRGLTRRDLPVVMPDGVNASTGGPPAAAGPEAAATIPAASTAPVPASAIRRRQGTRSGLIEVR
jgi:hypothetical protein